MSAIDWSALAVRRTETRQNNQTQTTVEGPHTCGPWDMTSIAENNRASVGLQSRITMIRGFHLEMRLIGGEGISGGGCHIQIGDNLLPVREDVEDAVAGMQRRLDKR